MTEQDAYDYDFEQLGDSTVPLQELDELGLEEVELARVVKLDRGLPLVVSATGTYRAEPSNTLVKRMKTNTMLRPAVGDWVGLAHPENHETARIEGLLPRISSFTRKDPGEETAGQVILANIDVVFVVTALGDEPINIARLERKLVLAFESGARPIIVLTKGDRRDDIEDEMARVRAVAGEVPIIVTSAVTGEGTEELRSMVPAHTTAAMIGSSGVGKSTLINCLLGDERLATKEVRESDDKGRHTTVAREIVLVPEGGILIDTPGMRGMALWRADQGLELAYPEIAEATQRCKFANCTHQSEPQCGVKEALEDGSIDSERLVRYTKLREELDELDVKQEEKRRAATESRPHGRGSQSHQIGKAKRNMRKYHKRNR
ncbi:MAG: ribosome small subunit-dependent GTPase A [Actinomycetia bacterium]|nr:ribosome small subunit-dependent GTPase A [Actinomycetes bacterium]